MLAGVDRCHWYWKPNCCIRSLNCFMKSWTNMADVDEEVSAVLESWRWCMWPSERCYTNTLFLKALVVCVCVCVMLRDHPCYFRNLVEVMPRTPYCPTFSYLRLGEGQGRILWQPQRRSSVDAGETKRRSESHTCLLVFDSSPMKKISSFAL